MFLDNKRENGGKNEKPAWQSVPEVTKQEYICNN